MSTPTLRRSRDRMIAGVCGGLAERFGWPVNRVRVAYVLLSILSAAFPGILVYLLLWFVMPDADEPPR
jgi:phage shock protein PspC (stress-responsive transcriptional regulator)